MIIKLMELFEDYYNKDNSDNGTLYGLREVYINPGQIVCLREDFSTQKKLITGLLPEGLDSRTRFTRVSLDRGHSGIDLIIVGDPDVVQAKLEKQILRG